VTSRRAAQVELSDQDRDRLDEWGAAEKRSGTTGETGCGF
jgi:hypothetical protein